MTAPRPVKPIRLMVVDDSGFMRLALRKMLERDDGIKVVGEARTGADAVRLAQELRPDVITMDVEMPEMDGVTATQHIMATCPVPVIMLSSVTQPGADVTIKALAAGAVDFISKASSFVQLDIGRIEPELREKIHFWGRQSVTAPKSARPAPASINLTTSASARRAPDTEVRPTGQGAPYGGTLRSLPGPVREVDLVVIGVSTGGPRMIPELFRAMGRLSCPVAVAQHMPELYTASFAQHLRDDLGLDVREGSQGMELLPGTVTILPGGTDSVLGRGLGGRVILSVRGANDSSIHPSANLLFESAVRVANAPVAVILTGMGCDGSRGAQKFVQRDLPVLAQDPATCVVGGMPGAAITAGVVTHVNTLTGLGRLLRTWCGAVG